jgi:hypothetical protein
VKTEITTLSDRVTPQPYDPIWTKAEIVRDELRVALSTTLVDYFWLTDGRIALVRTRPDGVPQRVIGTAQELAELVARAYLYLKGYRDAKEEWSRPATYSISKAAEKVDCTMQTIRRAIKAGHLAVETEPGGHRISAPVLEKWNKERYTLDGRRRHNKAKSPEGPQ